DMLQTISERGRRFLSFNTKTETTPAEKLRDLERACQTLLSSQGEASGMALATTILTRWKQFDSSQQREFIALLLERFGPDRERLAKAIDGYQSDPGSKTLLELHNAAEPRRQELIRRLNLAPNGIATLVRMREAILKLKADQPDFEAVDADFAH